MSVKCLLSGILALCCTTVSAQHVSGLMINEVLVSNTAGIADGYGNRCGWIEILNNSYGTVDFGGCYISDDRDNLKKNIIPKGDVRTKLGPRQLALFFADGKETSGTFYVNFILAGGSTIYLTSNDGKTIIDSLSVPGDIGPDKSVSRIAEDNKGRVFSTKVTEPTPLMQNSVADTASKSQILAGKDRHGIIISITSISVVFFALALLYLCYSLTGRIFSGKNKITTKQTGKKMKSEQEKEVALAIAMALEKECGGEIFAAISMALHLYMDDCVHDQESFAITIKPTLSAWASRHFTLRQIPVKK